jgi:hypothetical protein
MKVIDNMKNIPIQEFQHSLESRLIEVMKTQMKAIQLVLIQNLIQIQLTEVDDGVAKSETGQVADTNSK